MKCAPNWRMTGDRIRSAVTRLISNVSTKYECGIHVLPTCYADKLTKTGTHQRKQLKKIKKKDRLIIDANTSGFNVHNNGEARTARKTLSIFAEEENIYLSENLHTRRSSKIGTRHHRCHSSHRHILWNSPLPILLLSLSLSHTHTLSLSQRFSCFLFSLPSSFRVECLLCGRHRVDRRATCSTHNYSYSRIRVSRIDLLLLRHTGSTDSIFIKIPPN